MHIESKITVWEKRIIPKELEEEVLKLCKEGKINDVNDLYDLIPNLSSEDLMTEQMWDTATDLDPSLNNGFPTLELHSDENYFNDKLLWDNGRRQKEE